MASSARSQTVPVYNWLFRKRGWGKQQEKQNPGQPIISTHYCLDGARGGTFYVQDQDHSDFLDQYALSIKTGCNLYISECRTPVFRFMSDLDIKRRGKPIEEEKILHICKLLQNTVLKYYNPLPDLSTFHMIILRTDEYQEIKCENQPNLFKTGVHVVFPNLYVTSHDALSIRLGIIEDLYKKYGNCSDEYNSWEDIVDEAVYTQNGLRMVFSRKIKKCPECSNDPEVRDLCNSCFGEGRIDLDRTYRPWKYFTGKGNESERAMKRLENVTTAVHSCSIRCTLNQQRTENFNIPDGVPTIGVGDKKYTMKNGIVIEGSAQDIKAQQSAIRGKQLIPPTDERYSVVQKFIRTQVHNPIYKTIRVHQIFMSKNGKTYFINVKGRNERYCINKGKCHSSNRIYFQLTEVGICQKCYCRNDEVRSSGRKCKDFIGKKFPLHDKIKALFFRNTSRGKIGTLYELRSQTCDNADYAACNRLIAAFYDMTDFSEDENDRQNNNANANNRQQNNRNRGNAMRGRSKRKKNPPHNGNNNQSSSPSRRGLKRKHLV